MCDGVAAFGANRKQIIHNGTSAQRHEAAIQTTATASRLNQSDQAPLRPGASIDIGLGLLD